MQFMVLFLLVFLGSFLSPVIAPMIPGRNCGVGKAIRRLDVLDDEDEDFECTIVEDHRLFREAFKRFELAKCRRNRLECLGLQGETGFQQSFTFKSILCKNCF